MIGPTDGFAARLAATDGLSLPARICLACVDALPIDGAGLSVMSPAGHLGTVASTDEAAARVEELQFELGEGPCLQAFSSGAPVLIRDVTDATDERLMQCPTFARGASEASVRALYAIPLQVGAIRIGVLDLYRRVSGSLTGPELSAALAIADVATLALLDPAGEDPDTGGRTGHSLGAAYHYEVHQATGVVMVQMEVGASEAFVLLRAYAFAHNRSVAGVAHDVIARRLQITPKGGDFDE